MVDIEFIAQYCVLRFSSEHPELLQWTDNMRILETVEQVGLLSSEDVAQLSDAYLVYRQAAHDASMQKVPSVVSADQFTEHRANVSRIWQGLLEN